MIYIKLISTQQKLLLIPRNLLILENVFGIMNFQCVSDLYFPINFASLRPEKKICTEEYLIMNK